MICRTPEEAFQAGWDYGKQEPPIPHDTLTYLAALMGPSIRSQLREQEEKRSQVAYTSELE